MQCRMVIFIVSGYGLISLHVGAQSTAELAALKGLAPVTVLMNTTKGKAALAANYTVTGGIQTGAVRQSTLLPFPEQQEQALRDAAITDVNLAELADGLGTTLEAAYTARAHSIDQTHSTKLSQSLSEVIAYADAIAGSHSNEGKFLFANKTTNGKDAVAPELGAIVADIHGETDVFGKGYGLPAGSPGADAYGDSRPFQTEQSVAHFTGLDYYNVPASNDVYNRGPIMNLINSPSYPSGHTTYGYTGALLLALLVPERYEQMVARGAEYGNDRIVIGAHYAMDVLGGRTLALYDMAHLLANDPAYIGQAVRGNLKINDFRAALKAARSDMTTALQAGCGKTIQECAREDIGRFSSPAANASFYADTQTYDLPVVYAEEASEVEDVRKIAPEAGYLLTVAFPALTLVDADRILTETEGPGGGFLDNGTPFGVYSRLNLYAAAERVQAIGIAQAPRAENSMLPSKTIGATRN